VIRLFLKLYGVLIATLALSFIVQSYLMDYVYRKMVAGYDFRSRFQPTFHLIEAALAPLPPEARPRKFREISAGFAFPARLEPADALPERPGLPEPKRTAYDEGAIVSLERPGGGFLLARRLGDGRHAVVLELPGPDNERIRLVTYAVNWTTEFAIVAILVGFWVRPLWRDITGLTHAAGRVGGGRFDAKVRASRGSALRPLADAFNGMTERIHALLQSHQALTSAVSHELRTPLARLRFSHSLAREEPDGEARDRYLALMEKDIAELDELTTELLDYAKLERGTPDIRLQVVPAAPWLEDVLADARHSAQVENRAATIRSDVGLETLRCEPRYMARAVVNLLRNALSHARHRIEVVVGHDGAQTVIHVDDDGAGIPSAERDRVFEPFARLDASRTRASGGFGLGLAIVKQVARWHGGDAFVTDSPLGGTRVTITW